MNDEKLHARAEAVAEALKGMSWDGQVTVLVETLRLVALDEREACVKQLSLCIEATKRQADTVYCCQRAIRNRGTILESDVINVGEWRKEQKAKMGVL